jgi:hypothetical protein
MTNSKANMTNMTNISNEHDDLNALWVPAVALLRGREEHDPHHSTHGLPLLQLIHHIILANALNVTTQEEQHGCETHLRNGNMTKYYKVTGHDEILQGNMTKYDKVKAVHKW